MAGALPAVSMQVCAVPNKAVAAGVRMPDRRPGNVGSPAPGDWDPRGGREHPAALPVRPSSATHAILRQFNAGETLCQTLFVPKIMLVPLDTVVER